MVETLKPNEADSPQYQIDIVYSLEPTQYQDIQNFYFSPQDKIHQLRREGLKDQTLTQDEFDLLMSDSDVAKIIITNNQKVIGLLAVTQNFDRLLHYSPTHLINVDEQARLPLFGDDQYQGHYPTILSCLEQEMASHNNLLTKQASHLRIILPALTQLKPDQAHQYASLIKSNSLFAIIDSIILDPDNAAAIQAHFTQGLLALNQEKSGLCLLQYPDHEADLPASIALLAHIDADIIDTQGYWAIRVGNPDPGISNLHISKTILTKEGKPHGKVSIEHVIQEDLNESERSELIQGLRTVEFEVCQQPLHPNSNGLLLNRTFPYATIINQELPESAFKVMVESNSDKVGLYIFYHTDTDGQKQVIGYFALLTPKGNTDTILTSETISQNTAIPNPKEEPYYRIIGLVSGQLGRQHITLEEYAKLLHISCGHYLNNGGLIIGDTDGSLLNLRLTYFILNANKLLFPNDSSKTQEQLFAIELQRYCLYRFGNN